MLLFILAITIFTHLLLPLLSNINRIVTVISLIAFLFIIHFGVLFFTVTVIKKDKQKSSELNNLGKKFLKYTLLTTRILFKNIVIVGISYLIIHYLIKGLSIFVRNYAAIGNILYIFLFIYILKAYLDVLITSSIVVCEPDDMTAKEMREIAGDFMDDNRFFILIYSSKEFILGFVFSILLSFLQFFIWKPSIVWKDMIGSISGTTYTLQSNTPYWWTVFSGIVIATIIGFALIKHVYFTFLYYQEINVQENEAEYDVENKRFLLPKIGLSILLVILVIVQIFSSNIFNIFYSLINADEIRQQRNDLFHELAENQKESKETEEKAQALLEEEFKENIKFEFEGLTENDDIIIKITNENDETASICQIEVKVKDELENTIEDSLITNGWIFTSGTPHPVVIPSKGFTYITGGRRLKEYYLKYHDLDAKFDLLSSQYTHASKTTNEGFDVHINDNENHTNIEIINNTGKQVYIMNILVLYYRNGVIVDFNEDSKEYDYRSKVQNGMSIEFEEIKPTVTYDDIKVLIHSAVHD